MSKSKNRVMFRIAIYIVIGLLALGTLAYALRFRILEWYLDGNKWARETVIIEITARAKVVIEKDIHMTLPQSIFSFLSGRRDQDSRVRDAIKDVISFSELAFKNRWLKFTNVHGELYLNGYDLKGDVMALEWHRQGPVDVLASFKVNFLKREPKDMRVNEKSSFFAELTDYVSKRARAN